MNNDGDYILWGFLYICAFIIAILITRAIFSIGDIVRNLKYQTNLLSKMAEKQGVSKEEIDMATRN